jgi:hypothetical protein
MNDITTILSECENLVDADKIAEAITKLAPLSFQQKKYEDYIFLKLQLIDTKNNAIFDDFKQRVQKIIDFTSNSQDIFENAIKRYEFYRMSPNGLIYRVPVNRKNEIIKSTESLLKLGSIVEDALHEMNKIFLNIENAIREIIIEYKAIANESIQHPFDNDYIKIMNLIDHFGDCARQLSHRHDNRETLLIKDEYDVQDLFHALLRLYFEDVRPEECTPSHAGSSSRIDFFIKRMNLAIEIKFATEKLRNKQLKEQLSIDFVQYQSHSNIKKLICFIYDPNHCVDNPRGFEDDLRQDSSLATEVFVRS